MSDNVETDKFNQTICRDILDILYEEVSAIKNNKQIDGREAIKLIKCNIAILQLLGGSEVTVHEIVTNEWEGVKKMLKGAREKYEAKVH